MTDKRVDGQTNGHMNGWTDGDCYGAAVAGIVLITDYFKDIDEYKFHEYTAFTITPFQSACN